MQPISGGVGVAPPQMGTDQSELSKGRVIGMAIGISASVERALPINDT
jgi:hypothetical protein